MRERGEVGVGSGASSTVLSICTSPSTLSKCNSSSNKADAGGHITTSTAAGSASVLGIEAGVGDRCVGTSKLNTSDLINVEEVGGDATKDDNVNIAASSGSAVGGDNDSSRASVEDGVDRSCVSTRAGSGSEDEK